MSENKTKQTTKTSKPRTRNSIPVNNILKLKDTMKNTNTPFDEQVEWVNKDINLKQLLLYYPNSLDPIYIAKGLYTSEKTTPKDTKTITLIPNYSQTKYEKSKERKYKTVNSVYDIIFEHYQNKIQYVMEHDYPNTRIYQLQEMLGENNYECKYDFENSVCRLFIPSKEKVCLTVVGSMLLKGSKVDQLLTIYHDNVKLNDIESIDVSEAYKYINTFMSVVENKDIPLTDNILNLKEIYNPSNDDEPTPPSNESSDTSNTTPEPEVDTSNESFNEKTGIPISRRIFKDYRGRNITVKYNKDGKLISKIVDGEPEIEVFNYSNGGPAIMKTRIKGYGDSVYAFNDRHEKIFESFTDDNSSTCFNEQGNVIYRRNSKYIRIYHYNANNFVVFSSTIDINSGNIFEEHFFYNSLNKLILYMNSNGILYENSNGITVDSLGECMDIEEFTKE